MFGKLRAETDELLHLDALRFVASLGIVVYHFCRFLSPAAQRAIGATDPLRLLVDLFFCISGFVIAYIYWDRLTAWPDYRAFLRRRVARLMPLHWLTFAFFLVLGVGVWTGHLHTDHPDDYDKACILPNALALHAWGFCPSLSFNFVSWSISAEMGMYLCAPLFLLAARRQPILLVAVAILAFGLFPGFGRQPWLYFWMTRWGVLRAIPSFAIGVLLYRYRENLAKIPGARWLALGGFCLFLAAERLGLPIYPLLGILYLTVACAAGADLSRRYPPLRIGALGQLTYSMYMLHPIVLTLGLSFVLQHVLHLQDVLLDAYVGTMILVTIAISYFSLLYFETPARHLLSGTRRRTRLAAADGAQAG